MLNEKKVILMTKMASYEDTEAKKNGAIGRYFRSDYIGFQVLKAIISATIACMIVGGMFILYDLENILENLYEMDLLLIAKRALFIYIVVVVVYALISYAVYSHRYSRARRKQKIYAHYLKQLGVMYDKQK